MNLFTCLLVYVFTCVLVYFLFPMNETSLKKKLSKINLGGLRYFDYIGSTNDEALAWAATGAGDLSIVIADEQTRGRGRLNRKWFTPKGSALAFSLILRQFPRPHLSRTVGLAALSIAESCTGLGLTPRIKWPNDIFINDKKIAGILIEKKTKYYIIGIGINCHQQLHDFPAELAPIATRALRSSRSSASLRISLGSTSLLRRGSGGTMRAKPPGI